MAKYQCPTLGDCERANTGEVFEREPGEDLKCPGCSTLLEPKITAGRQGPRFGAVPLAIAAVLVVLAAGGGYAYYQGGAQETVVAAQASGEPAQAVAAPAPAAGERQVGIAPSADETAVLRREGEAHLVDGKAAQAEAAGSKAAANEMLKVAIAKMAQGKLDDAEKELAAARERAPEQPLVYYNTAVLRLKQARTEEALQQFEAAFMAGFTHFKEMDADTDLDALRADPRFAELVKKFRPAGA
ncbi:TPR end-of-group domain-containing protein [Massilia sp.]|uniref:TPR end-of-group domain-containing protein n=1 Tax=Massilia sp. TaxID=1882437 RepID=UPI0028B1A1AC|nr:tetratricopeptide repeat protein [Massilia sp.]